MQRLVADVLVTMSAARSVTATFSGGSSTQVALSVAVTGHGTVTGGGITCGNGRSVCTARQRQGASVGLTATRAPGATFDGWGGACSGKAPTCTVEMDEAKRVTAAFSAAPGSAAGSAALRSLGRPVVSRTASGFQVTLRFRTGERGRARVQALRAGRVQTALAFTAAAGAATVGPFPVAKPGFYTFDLRLGTRTLRWTACLGPLRRTRNVEPLHARARPAEGRRGGQALVGHPPLPLVAAGRRRRTGLPRQTARPRDALPDPGR